MYGASYHTVTFSSALVSFPVALLPQRFQPRLQYSWLLLSIHYSFSSENDIACPSLLISAPLAAPSLTVQMHRPLPGPVLEECRSHFRMACQDVTLRRTALGSHGGRSRVNAGIRHGQGLLGSPMTPLPKFNPAPLAVPAFPCWNLAQIGEACATSRCIRPQQRDVPWRCSPLWSLQRQ